MPIYAYKCASCGFAQDEMLKISDAALTVCPACGQPEYTKQLSAAGFQLKGSGWYATDFKGGNKPAPESPAPAAKESTSAVTPPATPTSNT
ncbi:MAG: FmdB family zinc ribbon protein [Thiobacillus sp.]